LVCCDARPAGEEAAGGDNRRAVAAADVGAAAAIGAAAQATSCIAGLPYAECRGPCCLSQHSSGCLSWWRGGETCALGVADLRLVLLRRCGSVQWRPIHSGGLLDTSFTPCWAGHAVLGAGPDPARRMRVV
jgi:hypothetical protein